MKAREEDLIKGIVVVGAISLLPVALRYVAPAARSLTRSTLKAGVLAYEKGRESLARFDEMFDDLVAEVREELLEEREAKEMAAEMDARFRAAQATAQATGSDALTASVALTETETETKR